MTAGLRQFLPCIVLIVACSPLGLLAQLGPPPETVLAPQSDFDHNVAPDPFQAQMLADMARQRQIRRQKEIVEDTDRLLDLAKQLKAAVDKTSRDQLAVSVIDTASQIEKLAKTVRNKMRDPGE